MIFSKVKTILGHAGAIYACKTIDDRVYTGSTDKHVARWLVDQGIQDEFAIKFESSVYALELIGSHYLVAGLSSGDLHIFDLEAGKEVKHFTQHVKAIFSLKWNHHTNHLIVGDADGNLSIWNTTTFELLIYLPLDSGKIRDIAISEDGKEFAIACQDETIRIIESTYFNEIKKWNAHKNGANSVCYHPKHSNQLISAGKDAHLKLWDIEKVTLQKDVPAHNYAIYSIIILNQGNTIVTSSRDKTIKIWSSDLEFQQRLDSREGGHKHSVNKVRKLDENRFVSVSDDKKVIIWRGDD